MIETHGKIYDYCGVCNKLVRLNKPLFGSMHVCSPPPSRAEMYRHGARGRERNRAVLRESLRIAGLPADGAPDDEFCYDDECGVSVGPYVLCYSEYEVFLLSSEGEIMLGSKLDARSIASRLAEHKSAIEARLSQFAKNNTT